MTKYVPRLQSLYDKEIREAMNSEYSYKNKMMIPRLDKIVLNMGVGEAVADSKKIKSAVADTKLLFAIGINKRFFGI